jgi:hypothetical protein
MQLGAMKDAWSEENDKIDCSTGEDMSMVREHRPSLLSGLTAPPDRATIMESLPDTTAAYKLIERFFDAYNPSLPARCK